MRSSILLCLVPVALCAAASPSPANVTISNAPTANMTCSGGVCSPTAVDAVLNVQGLQSALAAGNVTVTTTGAGVQATNIHVNARLSWSAATTLNLDAFRSIEVNGKVVVAGSGGVFLTTNDGGSGGEFACNDNGGLEFSNLSSALTINGASYMLVNSVASLASAIAANPSGAFALAKNYNAKKDGTYATPPIPTVFSGSFNGLGNAISNLSINDPVEDSYVGLFAQVTGGSIANARLLNENVQGGSGSSVENSKEFIGGLVGYAEGGSIAHSFTSGTVSGDDYVAVGGLTGVSAGSVLASGSAATVSNASSSSGGAGGLIGIADGSVSRSYATGSISGAGFIGGLVGFFNGSLLNRSWASGIVSSTDGSTWVGGLAGANQRGRIERSHASGNVTCALGCGGLVGWQTGYAQEISQSFATGSVSASIGGGTGAGGLVGFNETGVIANSYATGAVSAQGAGGLVAQNFNNVGYHAISNSYSTGVVTGQSGSTGGLLGGDESTSTIKHAYWDMTTSGITDPGQGAGFPANDPGIKGLSDKKLKSGLPRGFNPKIWNEDSAINGGLPYLIHNPPPN